MRRVTLEKAGFQLAALVRDAQNGAEVILTQNNGPLAQLTLVGESKPRPQFGKAKDVIVSLADNFNAPLEDFAEYM